MFLDDITKGHCSLIYESLYLIKNYEVSDKELKLKVIKQKIKMTNKQVKEILFCQQSDKRKFKNHFTWLH